MTTNPKDVKSQHELSTTNDGKRSSDVLLSTIEELEKTKKQLECGVNRELLYLKKIEKLEKQLEIAKKALDVYAYQTIKGTETYEDGEEYDIEYPYSNDDGEVAKTALKQIEEQNK